MNLVGNAIKFTDEGSIAVSLSARDRWIELSVRDTGIGIPAADLPHIFDEFRQVDSKEKKREGSGLGLAIARKSAEMLGGTLTARSRVGEGSTFTLRLSDYPTTPPQGSAASS